jgi:tripartite-type tricarboxylate transporter receptor subunit TctC
MLNAEIHIFLYCVLVLIAFGSSASSAIGAPSTAGEDDVAAFYTGKTVRIIVGYPPGGGYDAYSRVIGRHLGKHIRGNPTVVVDNMAGAGSIVAANHMFNVAPKDGTSIGNISGPIILEQLFGNSAVRFDMARFRYLAVPIPETYLLLVHRRMGVTKFEQLLSANQKQVTIGGVPNNTIEHAAVIIRDVMGANVKVVSGYKGTSDIRLAMESGEIDGFFNTWTSARIAALELINNGEWLILAQLTDAGLPDLPKNNIPTIAAISRTEEQRQLLRLGISAPSAFAKLYLMPPGVAENRAQAMESAFTETFRDSDFLKDAEKAKIEIRPLPGMKTASLVTQVLQTPADLKIKLKNILHKS